MPTIDVQIGPWDLQIGVVILVIAAILLGQFILRAWRRGSRQTPPHGRSIPRDSEGDDRDAH